MAYRVKGEKGGYGDQYAKKALGLPSQDQCCGTEEQTGPRNKRDDRPAPKRQEDNTRENLLRGMPSLQKKAPVRYEAPNPLIASKSLQKRREGGMHEGDDLSDTDDSGDDTEFMKMRAKRMREMKERHQKYNKYLQKGHSKYEEVSSDEFLPAVTGSKYVVCHFYHKDFERCKIVDKHMRILAPKHIPVRFITINAEKSPFFVKKMNVRVLPTICIFIDGVTTQRLVGFNDLGKTDDFPTHVLEAKLGDAAVLIPQMQPKERSKICIGSIRMGTSNKTVDGEADANDSGSDLDL